VTGPRRARRVAIDILYQADLTGREPEDVIADWERAGREVPEASRQITAGVTEHGPSIDLLLEEVAEGWTVARMAVLDRTILRVGAYELRHRPDVPPSVAVSEAVEAATDLSSDEARRFVNGVLGRIAAQAGGGAVPDEAGRPDPEASSEP
jgi:N utilization substance protein B